MPLATLTSKGQITLPKEIRELLKLEPGDRLEFLIADDGTVTVWPVTADVTSLKGILPRPERAVSIEKMREEMSRAIRRRGGGQ